MTTQEKIYAFKDFMFDPDHAHFVSEDRPWSTYKGFNIETTMTATDIDFSHCEMVTGLNEAVEILQGLNPGREWEEIELDVLAHIGELHISPNQQFYLTVIGQRREQ